MNKPRILCFGLGTDSSVLLHMEIKTRCFDITAAVFSDTGAEFEHSYKNLERFKKLCADADIPLHVISHKKENLMQFVDRLGNLPLLPSQRGHACSKKFKGDVIEQWAKEKYGPVEFLVGLEAGEDKRSRFVPPKGNENEYRYPLRELNMTRADCVAYLEEHGLTDIGKSSCVFCPFFQLEEIEAAVNDPKAMAVLERVEGNFKKASKRKHQAWLDAGSPLNKGGRCNAGHWRLDSYAEGHRLFAKTVKGKRLTVQEWKAYFAALKEKPAQVVDFKPLISPSKDRNQLIESGSLRTQVSLFDPVASDQCA